VPIASTEPVPRTTAATVVWISLGFAGAAVGAFIAMRWTLNEIPADNDSGAVLGIFLTAPFGAIVGVVVVLLAARSIDRRSPWADPPSRKMYTLIGGAAPLVLFAGLFLLLTVVF